MRFGFFPGVDLLNPSVHLMLLGNGTAAWPGCGKPAKSAQFLQAPGLELLSSAQPRTIT